MLHTLQPDVTISPSSVSSSYRVYVLFTKQVIPLWTRVLKFFMSRYQGASVEYTHCLVATHDLLEQEITLYEMSWLDGMFIYDLEGVLTKYDGDTLTIIQSTFFGGTTETTYRAVDITQLIHPTDIICRWDDYYTDIPITPWSLYQHLTPAKLDKITWTCSGLVQALLTGEPLVAYRSPMTPDMLLESLIE
jgi:hypothetical protein